MRDKELRRYWTPLDEVPVVAASGGGADDVAGRRSPLVKDLSFRRQLMGDRRTNWKEKHLINTVYLRIEGTRERPLGISEWKPAFVEREMPSAL